MHKGQRLGHGSSVFDLPLEIDAQVVHLIDGYDVVSQTEGLEHRTSTAADVSLIPTTSQIGSDHAVDRPGIGFDVVEKARWAVLVAEEVSGRLAQWWDPLRDQDAA
ncbi:hypothetical protein PG989_011871 [Apiospora arundinis]